MFSKIYLMSIVDGLKNTVIQHLSSNYEKAEKMAGMLWGSYSRIKEPFLRWTVVEIENDKVTYRSASGDSDSLIGEREADKDVYLIQIYGKGRHREYLHKLTDTYEEIKELIDMMSPKLQRQCNIVVNKITYRGVYQIDVKTGKETQINFKSYDEDKDTDECWFPDGFDIIKL